MKYKKLLTFSFDDGITQDMRFIEILNKYGLKCTFNLNSQLLGESGEIIVKGVKVSHNKVNPEDIKIIYKGHEVASHTLTHPFLPDIEDESEIIRQVEEDRKALSKLVGYEVRGFAYPGGGINYSERVARIIEKNTNIEFARTTVATNNFELQNDLFMFNPTTSLTKDKDKVIELCKNFVELKTDEPKLFYIWGHSYELDAGDWEHFEEVCKLISGHEDIYYCTNSQAFDYLKGQVK